MWQGIALSDAIHPVIHSPALRSVAQGSAPSTEAQGKRQKRKWSQCQLSAEPSPPYLVRATSSAIRAKRTDFWRHRQSALSATLAAQSPRVTPARTDIHTLRQRTLRPKGAHSVRICVFSVGNLVAYMRQTALNTHLTARPSTSATCWVDPDFASTTGTSPTSAAPVSSQESFRCTNTSGADSDSDISFVMASRRHRAAPPAATFTATTKRPRRPSARQTRRQPQATNYTLLSHGVGSGCSPINTRPYAGATLDSAGELRLLVDATALFVAKLAFQIAPGLQASACALPELPRSDDVRLQVLNDLVGACNAQLLSPRTLLKRLDEAARSTAQGTLAALNDNCYATCRLAALSYGLLAHPNQAETVLSDQLAERVGELLLRCAQSALQGPQGWEEASAWRTIAPSLLSTLSGAAYLIVQLCRNNLPSVLRTADAYATLTKLMCSALHHCSDDALSPRRGLSPEAAGTDAQDSENHPEDAASADTAVESGYQTISLLPVIGLDLVVRMACPESLNHAGVNGALRFWACLAKATKSATMPQLVFTLAGLLRALVQRLFHTVESVAAIQFVGTIVTQLTQAAERLGAPPLVAQVMQACADTIAACLMPRPVDPTGMSKAREAVLNGLWQEPALQHMIQQTATDLDSGNYCTLPSSISVGVFQRPSLTSPAPLLRDRVVHVARCALLLILRAADEDLAASTALTTTTEVVESCFRLFTAAHDDLVTFSGMRSALPARESTAEQAMTDFGSLFGTPVTSAGPSRPTSPEASSAVDVGEGLEFASPTVHCGITPGRPTGGATRTPMGGTSTTPMSIGNLTTGDWQADSFDLDLEDAEEAGIPCISEYASWSAHLINASQALFIIWEDIDEAVGANTGSSTIGKWLEALWYRLDALSEADMRAVIGTTGSGFNQVLSVTAHYLNKTGTESCAAERAPCSPQPMLEDDISDESSAAGGRGVLHSQFFRGLAALLHSAAIRCDTMQLTTPELLEVLTLLQTLLRCGQFPSASSPADPLLWESLWQVVTAATQPTFRRECWYALQQPVARLYERHPWETEGLDQGPAKYGVVLIGGLLEGVWEGMHSASETGHMVQGAATLTCIVAHGAGQQWSGVSIATAFQVMECTLQISAVAQECCARATLCQVIQIQVQQFMEGRLSGTPLPPCCSDGRLVELLASYGLSAWDEIAPSSASGGRRNPRRPVAGAAARPGHQWPHWHQPLASSAATEGMDVPRTAVQAHSLFVAVMYVLEALLRDAAATRALRSETSLHVWLRDVNHSLLRRRPSATSDDCDGLSLQDWVLRVTGSLV